MQSCATYDDVSLVLRLYELRREERLRQARDWFAKEFRAKTIKEFNEMCPAGSDDNASFRMVVSYWEMTSSFIVSGVLHSEIFFESARELLFVYERIRAMLPDVRKEFGDPKFLDNLEKVGKLYIEWMKERSPGSYENYVKRVVNPAR